ARTQRRKIAIIDGDEPGNSASKRKPPRPHACDCSERRRAPTFLRQERKVETRQNDQRHQQVDAHHDDQRQEGPSDRRRGGAVLATMDFGGIEFARGRCELAYYGIVRRGINHRAVWSTVAFPERRPPPASTTTSRTPA